MPNTRTAHLVGSIPLPDAETVFRTVSQALGSSIRRIPDGETGDRSRWIWFQRAMLESHPDMEIDTGVEPFRVFQWDGKMIRETPWIKFKDDVDPSAVSFPTGYRDAAVESYQVYARLRDEGVIGPDVRFQVSIPTPMATAYMYISPDAREAYIPAYERSLVEAVSGILDAIPHDRLAIQWDVCQEVLLFEDYFEGRPAGYKQQVFEELARMGGLIPETVELGYHLCYGSPADEHLVMPKDMGVLVEIANGFASRLSRRLDFLHLPVPKDRTDAGYFEPLRSLTVAANTEVMLGLIHYDDAQGDAARIATASDYLTSFGVATECGWGRTDPARVTGLLESHARAAGIRY
ncbi:MAG: hypothetical protein IIB89_09375 [Chloroflexi bacterium]|nr:hypothetical protein [Chloroflexota bacterium]